MHKVHPYCYCYCYCHCYCYCYYYYHYYYYDDHHHHHCYYYYCYYYYCYYPCEFLLGYPLNPFCADYTTIHVSSLAFRTILFVQVTGSM